MHREKLDIVSCAAETPARTGTVRVGGLMGFGELVEELGGDPQRLIAACGLAPETLRNPDNIIPFGAGARLMHLAETLRVDLNPARIKVQLFNPGFIRTRLTDKNSFRMPQLMEPEAAAEVILRGMKGRRFQTSFPVPFAWMFRFSKFLPDWLYFRLFRQG